MNTDCPVCGTCFSLDTLIEHEEAREVNRKIYAINERLERPLIKYMGLFRPAKTRRLSFSRMASLLNELLPGIQSQQISRNGNIYSVPPEAWIWGVEQVLAVRQTLTLPLKGHGYLYEVLSRWEGQGQYETLANDAVVTGKTQNSKTFEGMDDLGELAGWIPNGL